jgi:signal transduction histidine kinase
MLAAVDEESEPGDAWHPPPGLARLPDLLDQARSAGTPVRLRIEGTPVTLPSPVDLSAYRIVQEALTNTRKHAGPGAQANIVLTYEIGEITIEISDDGQHSNGHGLLGNGRAGNDGTGNGLRGMRERARLLGGRFTAGPEPHGGFTVRATLPVEGRGA